VKRLSFRILFFVFVTLGLSYSAGADDASLVSIKPSQLVSPQWKEVALAAVKKAAVLYGWSNTQEITATRQLAAFAMINVYQYTGRDLYLAVDGSLVDDNHDPLFSPIFSSTSVETHAGAIRSMTINSAPDVVHANDEGAIVPVFDFGSALYFAPRSGSYFMTEGCNGRLSSNDAWLVTRGPVEDSMHLPPQPLPHKLGPVFLEFRDTGTKCKVLAFGYVRGSDGP